MSLQNEHLSDHFMVPPPELPSVPIVRLPEIPLSNFDGDIYNWPLFSDRFTATVDQRLDLFDIGKCYLVDCLKGNVTNALCGIYIPRLT